MRDGTDEIAAALVGDDFADLVSLADVRGAVHCHTTYSDGKASLAPLHAERHRRLVRARMSDEVLTIGQVIARIRPGQPPVTIVEDATGRCSAIRIVGWLSACRRTSRPQQSDD